LTYSFYDKAATNIGFCATWARPAIFSFSPLPGIGYGLDRLLFFFRLAFAFHFLIYIVVWADTASNTQAAQSPARCMQGKGNNSFSLMICTVVVSIS